MKNSFRIMRIATRIILAYLIVCGAAMVLFPLKPFWRDEWCIIYNIKFRTPEMLWGRLDFTQQFPRVFLQLLKVFTASFNYSYFSLRFPSFLMGVIAIFLGYNLMNRIFPEKQPARFLFVLIIAAHPVFIDYFVQVKHYEMEILLSIVAIWQFLELLDIKANAHAFNARYVLLCTSFLVVPFFSYTYPIAILPAFIIMFIRSLFYFKNKAVTGFNQYLFYLWLPLFLCMVSIVVFYFIDIRQLLSDRNMYGFWDAYLNGSATSKTNIFGKIWLLFAKTGAGYLFEIVFGILGIVSFANAAGYIKKNLKAAGNESGVWIRLYGALLLTVVICLHLTGKLPLGEPKFNAFAVPSISLLIVFFVSGLHQSSPAKKFASILNIILFIALTANIFTAFLNRMLNDTYRKQLSIYRATEKAINLAYKNKIPLLITPGIGFPDDITTPITFLSLPSPAGILKTFPAYRANDTIAVYTINDLKEANNYKISHPNTTSVLAGDGLSYQLFNW